MAGLGDIFKGNIVTAVVIGVGAIILAPVAARAAKPLTKAALKGGLIAFEKGKEAFHEVSEVVEGNWWRRSRRRWRKRKRVKPLNPLSLKGERLQVPPKAGPEAPSAHISHATKGRVRFKIPSKKGHARFFTNVKDVLEKNARVSGVVIDPVTGSVLVTHNTDTASIIKLAESNKFFKLGRRRPQISNNLVESFKCLDSKLRSATDGELDLPTTSFLTLAGVGIYEIARGNFVAPAWYTAFWYALNIFLKARPDANEIEKELVPLGIVE